MFNLDLPSLHLHYLHQNGPSLTLNPLCSEQISALNLHALPSVGKVFGGIFISIRQRWSDTTWTAARMRNKCVPAASACDFLSPVSWRSRHPSLSLGFLRHCQKRVWWQQLSQLMAFFISSFFFCCCCVFIIRCFFCDSSKSFFCKLLLYVLCLCLVFSGVHVCNRLGPG